MKYCWATLAKQSKECKPLQPSCISIIVNDIALGYWGFQGIIRLQEAMYATWCWATDVNRRPEDYWLLILCKLHGNVRLRLNYSTLWRHWEYWQIGCRWLSMENPEINCYDAQQWCKIQSQRCFSKKIMEARDQVLK